MPETGDRLVQPPTQQGILSQMTLPDPSWTASLMWTSLPYWTGGSIVVSSYDHLGFALNVAEICFL